MPNIVVTKCVDHLGNNLEGAIVIAISQEDMFDNIIHTDEGSDWPTMAFAKANLTNSEGKCIISATGAKYATVAFVYDDEEVASDIRPHIDLAPS